jgi:hypothetical protein
LEDNVMTEQQRKDAAGLADIMHSVGVLARHAREFVEKAGGVVQSELATVLTITEDVRDRMVSKEALQRAREQPLLRDLRKDAHRGVDIAFDAAATVYVFGVEIVERILERPRLSGTTAVQATA